MNDPKPKHDDDQSIKSCVICGSSDSIAEYPFLEASKNNSAIELCMEHRRLFDILGQPDSPNPAGNKNREAQKTQKVTTRIPRSLLEAADDTAETQGQTRSEMVRDALQVYIELHEINSATNDLLVQSVTQSGSGIQKDNSTEDVEFLKQRIRALESLLEDSIEKI